jgi:hypothetical protein
MECTSLLRTVRAHFSYTRYPSQNVYNLTECGFEEYKGLARRFFIPLGEEYGSFTP